jgi:hypothetical protein
MHPNEIVCNYLAIHGIAAVDFYYAWLFFPEDLYKNIQFKHVFEKIFPWRQRKNERTIERTKNRNK